jgi:hypothetical protein
VEGVYALAHGDDGRRVHKAEHGIYGRAGHMEYTAICDTRHITGTWKEGRGDNGPLHSLQPTAVVYDSHRALPRLYPLHVCHTYKALSPARMPHIAWLYPLHVCHTFVYLPARVGMPHTRVQIHIHIRTHIHIHFHTHTRTHKQTDTQARTHADAHTDEQTGTGRNTQLTLASKQAQAEKHTRARVHTYAHACAYTHTPRHTHACAHTHTHQDTHTHIHTLQDTHTSRAIERRAAGIRAGV